MQLLPFETEATGRDEAAVIFNPSVRQRPGRRHRPRGGTGSDQARPGVRTLTPRAGPRKPSVSPNAHAPLTDIVVAIGGDGTVNEVTNGMARARDKAGPGARQPGFGIVPAGTVNVLALELGMPFQVERACEVIAGGKTISLDLGKVNDRRFVLMMGAGIDALTVRNIDLQAKRRFKELAFVGTGLKTGLRTEPGLLGARQRRGVPRHVLGRGQQPLLRRPLRHHPMADPTDGVLDLVLFTGWTARGLAAFWLGVPTGLHLRGKNVIYLHAETRRGLPGEQ